MNNATKNKDELTMGPFIDLTKKSILDEAEKLDKLANGNNN